MCSCPVHTGAVDQQTERICCVGQTRHLLQLLGLWVISEGLHNGASHFLAASSILGRLL